MGGKILKLIKLLIILFNHKLYSYNFFFIYSDLEPSEKIANIFKVLFRENLEVGVYKWSSLNPATKEGYWEEFQVFNDEILFDCNFVNNCN